MAEKTKLKIPQGTQNGRSSGFGRRCFEMRKDSCGDEILVVVLQSPNVQNERTRELLRELASVQTEDLRAEMWEKDFVSALCKWVM